MSNNGVNIEELRSVGSYRDLRVDDVNGLVACVDSAFDGRVTTEDAREHIAGDQILIARQGSEFGTNIVGFSSTSVISPSEEFGIDALSTVPGAYFAGAAIHKTFQKKGLYVELNRLRLTFSLEAGVDTIFTRTQNPRVQEGITNALRNLVMIGQLKSFAVERVLSKGTYGKMLTADKPTSKTVTFDDIDYENGDATIIFWNLDK